VKLDRWTLCVHEAGHTVVGRMFGLGCIGVLIDHPALEPRGLNGVSMVLPSSDPRVQAMVALGGFCAQLRLDPDNPQRAFEGAGCAFDDNGNMSYADRTDWETIERCTGGNSELFQRWALDVQRAFAIPLVWAKVERVATELCERGRLWRADVDRLLAE
jgi:hypothetical protein